MVITNRDNRDAFAANSCAESYGEVTQYNDPHRHHAALQEARRQVQAEALPGMAILIFLADLALSRLAHSIDQLVAFRAIQGLGAGGLMIGQTRPWATWCRAALPGGYLAPAAAHCEAQDDYLGAAPIWVPPRSRWPPPRSCC
jgi:hypothetical protein